MIIDPCLQCTRNKIRRRLRHAWRAARRYRPTDDTVIHAVVCFAALNVLVLILVLTRLTW